MKKFLTLLFASSLVLGACGDDGGSESEESATTDETEEVVEEEEVESTEEEEEKEGEKEIVLGEPMNIGDYTMTITDYSLGVDYDGNDALIITYDWENTSDETASPFMTFMMMGFQDNAQTDDVFMVEDVDLEPGQKEYKPGGKVEGAHDAVGIDNLDQPLVLELEELMSFEDEVYSTTIDLSELQ